MITADFLPTMFGYCALASSNFWLVWSISSWVFSGMPTALPISAVDAAQGISQSWYCASRTRVGATFLRLSYCSWVTALFTATIMSGLVASALGISPFRSCAASPRTSGVFSAMYFSFHGAIAFLPVESPNGTMVVGMMPRANRMSESPGPRVAMRLGSVSMVVSPRLWVMVTGRAPASAETEAPELSLSSSGAEHAAVPTRAATATVATAVRVNPRDNRLVLIRTFLVLTSGNPEVEFAPDGVDQVRIGSPISGSASHGGAASGKCGL